MKILIHILLALAFVTSSFASSGGDLSSIVLELESAQSARVLTAKEKALLQSKFEAKVSKLLENKSDSEVLNEISELVSSMPEGQSKQSLVQIIEENKSTPALAIHEVVNSRSFEKLKSGESANWSVFETPSFYMALGGVIFIAAILIFNRSLSKMDKFSADSKQDSSDFINDWYEDAMSPNTYVQPQSGLISFQGTGSALNDSKTITNEDGTTKTEYESCYSYGPGGNAETEAKANAVMICSAHPLMTPAKCKTGYLSASVSGSGSSFCSATATLTLKF